MKKKEPTLYPCHNGCFLGWKGDEECRLCHTTGSVFRISFSNADGFRTFPSTHRGYKQAKAFLNSDRKKRHEPVRDVLSTISRPKPPTKGVKKKAASSQYTEDDEEAGEEA